MVYQSNNATQPHDIIIIIIMIFSKIFPISAISVVFDIRVLCQQNG